MKKYLLDTNICIFFIKGQYQLDKKIAEIGEKIVLFLLSPRIASMIDLKRRQCPDEISNSLEIPIVKKISDTHAINNSYGQHNFNKKVTPMRSDL